MRRAWLLPFLLVSLAHAQKPARLIPIAIETSYGTIEAELDSAHAPVTVANFLRYVDGHLYDSARFHRVVRMDNQPNNDVKIEVIQGGLGPGKARGFPPMRLSAPSVTGLHHGDGVLSVARNGPDTGSSDFFIVVGDQPSLDFGGKRNADGQGFAAFGRVTKGMDIVKKIQAQPADAQQSLVHR